MNFGYSNDSLWNTMSNSWNQEQSSTQPYLNQLPVSNPLPYPCLNYNENINSSNSIKKADNFQDVPKIPEEQENTPQEKPKKRFSRVAVQILEDYVRNNIENPFPSEPEKERLADLAGITKCQVSTWFTNTRRRRWKDMKEEVNETRNPRRKIQVSPRKPLAPIPANIYNSCQGTPTYPSHPFNIYPTPPSAMQTPTMIYSNPSTMNMQVPYIPQATQAPFPTQPLSYNPSYQSTFSEISPAYPPYNPSLPNEPFVYGNNPNLYY